MSNYEIAVCTYAIFFVNDIGVHDCAVNKKV